jgi:hypothetical protein
VGGAQSHDDDPAFFSLFFPSCFFFLFLGANFRFLVYLTFCDFDTCKPVFCFVLFPFKFVGDQQEDLSQIWLHIREESKTV